MRPRKVGTVSALSFQEETGEASGLFGSHHGHGRSLSIHLLGNHFANRGGALAAIELAAMVGLYSFGAARAGIHGLADRPAVDTIANANDHANHLQQLRMSVNQTFLCSLLG